MMCSPTGHSTCASLARRDQWQNRYTGVFLHVRTQTRFRRLIIEMFLLGDSPHSLPVSEKKPE